MHHDTMIFGGMKFAAMATGTAGMAASVATGDWSVYLFGVQLQILLAAFGGAVVSLSFLAVQRAWYITVGVGTVAGAYATPLAAHSLGIEQDLHRGVAFTIALMLQIIVPALTSWIKRKGDGNA